ncbi:c-type cytochrome [Pannonibacter sp.]|uniref:c-type cytochrome n=1 Tax=Pannonibacter sp. TaxID=1906786 RepID=UPI003F6ECBB6
MNLIKVMALGIAPQNLSLTHGFGLMPAFADRLSPQQMADLANYVRSAVAFDGKTLPILR